MFGREVTLPIDVMYQEPESDEENTDYTQQLRERLERTYERVYTLRKKLQLGTLFVSYLEPSGKKVPKRVLYMFKNLKRFRI